MKIGIFLHPYGEREPAGLGRAIFDLTAAMIAAAPDDQFLIFVKGNPPRPASLPGINWSWHSLGEGLWWRDRAFRRAVSRADVCLFNTPILPLLHRPKKSIVIALDFAYLDAGSDGVEGFFRRFLLRLLHGRALRACSRVIAISEATRRDAIRLFGIPASKIATVHLGYRRLCDMPEAPSDAPDKFFLFVGVIKERKNVRAIVRAFDRFAATHPDYHLLLAGKTEGEYGNAVKREADASNAAERIRFLGYRSDAELAYLYRRAIALVYPSKVEGFGLPVLEAMQCGTAVITSRVSSLPELAGEAGILVDPDSIDAIASAMGRVADDPAFRADLVLRGAEQAAKFSWEKSAREILTLIRAV